MRLFKTAFCWYPIRVARLIRNAPFDKPNMEFIGWTWLKTESLTRNINHGWIVVKE